MLAVMKVRQYPLLSIDLSPDARLQVGNLTIALYRRLVGIDEFSDSGHEREAKGFDISCVSRLNDLSQRQKINIIFRFKTEEVESGQKWYQCSVYRNDQLLAGGSGISKRVAKALAAESALSVLTCAAQNTPPPPIKKSLAEEEKSRRHLFVLGVDIDSKLIKKATMKTVDVIGGDVICFKTGDLVDTVASNRLLQTFCRENCNGQTDGQARFTLVTCFSVLMWIHINHGDDGLKQFLQYLSDSTDHLLVELQKWKCYRYSSSSNHYMTYKFDETQACREEIEASSASCSWKLLQNSTQTQHCRGY